MAENDEPIEDLKAVGLTAGAAAARTIEVIVRDQQNRQNQQMDPQTSGQAQDAADARKAASWADMPGGLLAV